MPNGVSGSTERVWRRGDAMEQRKMDQILRNEWERYDTKKMGAMKAAFVAMALVILWALIFIPLSILPFELIPYVNKAAVAIGTATLSTVLVGVIAMVKAMQIDRGKKDWYFSALEDARLKGNDILGIVRAFLATHGYPNPREDSKTAFKVHITHFDIYGADFKLRVWFNESFNPPIVEIGFGPETMLNKLILSKLRADMSSEFVKRYGVGGTNPFQGSTRYGE